MWNFILHKCSLSIFSYTKYDNFFFITLELKKAWYIPRPVSIHQFWWMHSHSQFIPKNSECIQFTIHFEKKWIIQFIIHLKMNQFIFNSWNHATLFIFMRWFCLISCECRSARLLRNWRRFSRRFFRSQLISVKMENLIFVWISGISGIQRIFKVSDVN